MKPNTSQETNRIHSNVLTGHRSPVKTFLLLIFCSLSFVLPAQDCYQLFLGEGASAFQSLDFEKALNKFNAAKVCDDCPEDQSEVRDWITKTQSGYIDAIKKARDEAIALKAEAEGLRFFSKGQEREFKGFYREAMDNFNSAVKKQPKDIQFRERRAQLAQIDKIEAYEIAKEDLSFLIDNGPSKKKAKYYNDLAFVEEQLDDLNGALVAQKTAASISPDDEQSDLYNSKVRNLSKRIDQPGSGTTEVVTSKAFIQIQEEKKGYCDFEIKIKIGDKVFDPLVDRIDVSSLKPGTYSYEISGDINCNEKIWDALGKGTINIRENSVYNLYYKKNQYSQCEMWISNY